MRDQVEKRYDRFSLFYDFLDTFPGLGSAEKKWRKHAIDLLRIDSDSVVVDIATGTGLIMPWIAEKGPKVVIGIDISRNMLEKARKRMEGMGEHMIIRGDVEALPFRDDSIDRVISTFSLTTIPGYEKAIDEMLRVLAVHGRGVILDTGKPKKGWAKAMHVLITPVAKLFGRTHFDRGVEGALRSRAKVIERSEFYGGMVYALVFEKVRD